MPRPRGFFGTAVLDDKMSVISYKTEYSFQSRIMPRYVVGGQNNDGRQYAVMAYNPAVSRTSRNPGLFIRIKYQLLETDVYSIQTNKWDDSTTTLPRGTTHLGVAALYAGPEEKFY